MQKHINNYRNMVAIQLIILFGFWYAYPFQVFPSLLKVVDSFGTLWNDGLIHEVFISLKLYLKALGISTFLALAISGATALPVVKGIDIGNIFKPCADLVAKFRLMSIVGFSIMFQILTPDMYWLKTSIIVFGITPWLIASLNNIVESTPISKLNYARTLRLSEFKVALEVKIWGNRDKAIEAFRQSAAMGFMMLTVAEKLAKDDGGLGMILSGQERFHEMAGIFAIQLFVFLALGIVQDAIIRFVRGWWCPYAILMEGERNGN